MKLAERIEIHPEVVVGKPVIEGTRVPVELLLGKLSEGSSFKAKFEILHE